MKHRGRFGLRKTGPNTRGRTTECLGKPDCIADLAEFAAGIVADTRSLRDHVTDLENDGIELRELRAIVDAADQLYASAGAVARELAAVIDDGGDWGERWLPR